jgi:ABC-type antimicrobial peptide transport system permease subunit
MTFRTLIRRSLRFHWRSHLGVVLGAAIGSAALIGALVVGDSVKGSLRDRAVQQVGCINLALDAGDRLFEANLAKRLLKWAATNFPAANANARYGGWILPVAKLNAVATTPGGTARAQRVNLYASSSGFVMPLGNFPTNLQKYPDGIDKIEVFANQSLATQLRITPRDEILIRLRKPGLFSGDAAMSPRGDSATTIRLAVNEVIAPTDMGDFSLRVGTTLPFNAFTTRATLGDKIIPRDRANLILSEFIWYEPVRIDSDAIRKLLSLLSKVIPSSFLGLQPEVHAVVANELQAALAEVWQIADLQTELILANDGLAVELRSERVFLDPPIVRSALSADTNAQPILTYLSTLLSAGTNSTPYSMVTAAGAPWTPADLRDDEIVVSQWLAEDLRVELGDEIAVSYFLPESGAKLIEATNTFRVHGIVSMEMPWADRTLMPDFPGIEKAESTSEWDAGFPLAYKVRPKDDTYWKQHRGTPKAFVTLAAGQKMWGNRFGNLTAIRFPIPTNATTALTPALSPGARENRSQSQSEPKIVDNSTASGKPKGEQQRSSLPGGEGQGEGERKTQTDPFEPPHVVAYKEALEKKILANLKPEELGLRFEPVREQALKAAAESQDFGGLFLGFSSFLIGAALLLMALLFSLGLEQRAPEIGTLLALGFTPKQVRSLLLREGVALAFLGGVVGALGGLAYAKAMLHGLTTIWRDAVSASALSFHYTMQTLVIGLFASVIVSVVTIWLTLRTFVKRPARELLVGEIGTTESKVQGLKSKVIAVGALLAGVALAGWAVVKGDTANAGVFFGAAALVLVAGLCFVNSWFDQLARPHPDSLPQERENCRQSLGESDAAARSLTLSKLGVRGCARRRKRSLGTVAMLACGSFLIVSIGVFRLDANRDATERSSGTGGFALIGETTMPVVQDLNSKSGREFFALNEGELTGVNFVPFRVREGDEASCLNLNRAQKPRLLGVKPEMLEERFKFAKGGDWKTLISTRLQPGEPMSHDKKNRLNGFLPRATDNTGLKSGASEIEIPAIGDANSIQWAMGKKVGDTIDYMDERGQPFKVRIVGAVANSILQGQLIIDETEFVNRFPGESGYRMFLVDAPSNSVSQTSATLSRAMQDVGLELTPAAQRLAQFNAVQNTYLGTFQVLGGLGLLLGSVGLGIVVLRNVLERRGELAVLVAVGFRKRTLQRLLLIENGALLVAGLVLGMIAAAVAVLPALLSAPAQLPYRSLALTLAAVLLNGALWTWVATRVALRGDLLAALRNE